MEDPIFSRPLRIRRIHIVGNKRTHRSVIENELRAAKSGRTVKEISTGIMHGLKALKQYESFDSVEVYCDVAQNQKRLRMDDPDMEYTDITVTVKEKRIVQLKAETYVEGSGSEGGVETSVALNNPLGYMEKINGSLAYGTKNSAAARVDFIKPKFRGTPFTLDINANHSTVSRAIYSSYDEKIKSLNTSLKSGKLDFGLTTAWRDIIPVRNAKNAFEYAASGLIIAQAKPTLKNSIHCTYTFDRRNHPYGPTEGSFFQLYTECAGFGGDVSFVKGQMKIQQFAPILESVLPDASHGITFTTGVLCPVSWPSFGGSSSSGASGDSSSSSTNNSNQPDRGGVGGKQYVGGSTAISDRFWLGGPMSLRGFNHKGVGPRTSPKLPGAVGGDALGGDMTWSLGYSMLLPFPHPLLHAAGVRCHLYANAGNLCAYETSFRTLIRGVRTSVGMGLVFPTSMGRIEANYSFVLRANSRDQQKRFQLGLGLDFL